MVSKSNKEVRKKRNKVMKGEKKNSTSKMQDTVVERAYVRHNNIVNASTCNQQCTDLRLNGFITQDPKLTHM